MRFCILFLGIEGAGISSENRTHFCSIALGCNFVFYRVDFAQLYQSSVVEMKSEGLSQAIFLDVKLSFLKLDSINCLHNFVCTQQPQHQVD